MPEQLLHVGSTLVAQLPTTEAGSVQQSVGRRQRTYPALCAPLDAPLLTPATPTQTPRHFPWFRNPETVAPEPSDFIFQTAKGKRRLATGDSLVFEKIPSTITDLTIQIGIGSWNLQNETKSAGRLCVKLKISQDMHFHSVDWQEMADGSMNMSIERFNLNRLGIGISRDKHAIYGRGWIIKHEPIKAQ